MSQGEVTYSGRVSSLSNFSCTKYEQAVEQKDFSAYFKDIYLNFSLKGKPLFLFLQMEIRKVKK